MKKIISLLMIAAMALTLLTSCGGKVNVPDDSVIIFAYEYGGASVLTNVAGVNAEVVVEALDGLEIVESAPNNDPNYNDGVYLMIEDDVFYLDLNGSNIVRVGKNGGYVEVEQFRFDAIIAIFEQLGSGVEFGK